MCVVVTMNLEVRILTRIGVNGEIGPQAVRITLPEGSSVESILAYLGVSADTSVLVLINGRRCDRSTKVGPNDRVALMTPVAGG
jgi:sulfur carrier protein ThiS